MDRLHLVARNGEAVRHALEFGDLLHLETASEEITDEFLLFAINSGLLKHWADSFPDPRQQPEISMQVLLAASLAARFAKLYSLRNTGFVLRAARVLGALGYSVEVVAPGQGLSARGTGDDSVDSGDVLRKLLVKLAATVALPPPVEVPSAVALPPAAEVVTTATVPARVSTPLTVRQRTSRRAVKQEVDEAEAAARGRAVGAQMVAWYNQQVGLAMLEYAQLGAGRRLHILDATPIRVALETATYACSGVVREDDGSYARGYKLATLRTLLDTAGLLTQVEIGPIQQHDLELCRELLHRSAMRCGPETW